MLFRQNLLNLINLPSIFSQKVSKHVKITKFKRNVYTKTYAGGDLDKTILNRYRNLGIPEDLIQVTYIWIDGVAQIRLKDRLLKKPISSVDDLPLWQYDGSSTYQAETNRSDLTLHPKAIYKDPFKPGPDDIIVLCETYYNDDTPTKSNKRYECEKNLSKVESKEVWFGFEQEYILLGLGGHPFGWPPHGYPRPQGPYYCGVGADNIFMRDINEALIISCLYAGIDLFGTNAEVMLSQFEFQTGPTLGIKAADDLWVARYILQRLAEDYGVAITFDPKPITGNWNGAGCHTNFSFKSMREENGICAIEDAISKLAEKHQEHIAVYDPSGGLDNSRRLVGSNETSDIDTFSSGVGTRTSSIRIPASVGKSGKGYLEDRRPSSNCDPYSVCNALVKTIFSLDEKQC